MTRAPMEVAKHFYDKYGCTRAIEIIAMRLENTSQEVDALFWNEVIKLITESARDEVVTKYFQHDSESSKSEINL